MLVSQSRTSEDMSQLQGKESRLALFLIARKSSSHVGFRVFSCFRKVCGLREPWGI